MADEFRLEGTTFQGLKARRDANGMAMLVVAVESGSASSSQLIKSPSPRCGDAVAIGLAKRGAFRV